MATRVTAPERIGVRTGGLGGAARHWLLAVNLIMALFIGGTLVPPVFMRLGLERPARLVYGLYGLTCHQLPQRSYFLFGPNGVDTYSHDEVVALGAQPDDLRAFVGNAQVGYKLGMAQRNTAIYATFVLAGLAFAAVRRRIGPLRWWLFLLFILPMAIDGGSHVVSEVVATLGGAPGFRETNAWLAALTGGALPAEFYTGTTAGSFNWLMRTLTGALFATGIVWFIYPYVDLSFRRVPGAVSHPVSPCRQASVPTGLDYQKIQRETK